MKVLFVIGNMGNGGAQRVASVICNRLALNGHEVSLLLFNRSKEEYPISDAVQIISLKDDFASYSAMNILSVIVSMRKHIKKIDPDVAIGFTNGGYALYLSSFGMKFPKIASARTSPHVIFGKKGLRAYINRLWFCKADAVVLQSKAQIPETPKDILGRCVVIPNPIDIEDGAETVSYGSHCEKIVMAGRLDVEKNYPLAISAMEIVCKTHPNARLAIYGKGILNDRIQDLIQEKGLEHQVTLAGWISNVRQKFLESDLFLLTSNFEGMPNSLMEAMACGLPCISTDCRTGPSDLITNGVSGILVPVGDAQALATAICDMIESKAEDRQRLGELARRTIAEHYCADKIVSQWEKLLMELIDK